MHCIRDMHTINTRISYQNDKDALELQMTSTTMTYYRRTRVQECTRLKDHDTKNRETRVQI